MLLDPKPSGPIEVFISYSHRDESLRNKLGSHLSVLERKNLVSIWHDRKIGPGEEWKGRIDDHLNSARIILLLISSDFIASKYCWDKEMVRAIQRHESGECRVIPIILRPTDWTDTPFGKFQALPKDSRPVVEWKTKDAAFLDIVKGIRMEIEKIRTISQIGPNERFYQTETINPNTNCSLTQPDFLQDTLRVIATDESDQAESSLLREKNHKESGEPTESKDEKKFLFMVDVMDQLPTAKLTLVSLSSYFKLTKQDLKWADNANRIISQLVEYCTRPLLTFHVSVDDYQYDVRRLLDNLRLLEVNYIVDLDEILRSAMFWGEDIIRSVFIEVFEGFLRDTTIGTFDYSYSPYDVIGLIVSYARRYTFIDNPELLENINIPFDRAIILKSFK
jgi:hypothetical protein